MDNVDLVRAFTEPDERFVRGDAQSERQDDLTAAVRFLDPDIEVHEPLSLPYGGTHRGHEGYVRLVQTIHELWEFNTGWESEFRPGGDDVVFVRAQFDGTARATGRRYAAPTIEQYTIVDGRITRIQVFMFDTAAAVAALGHVP